MGPVSPELQVWLALLGPAVTAGAAVIGGLFALWKTISRRFTTMDEKIDEQTAELKRQVTDLYVKHEERDQERHVENVQRLTRLETLAGRGSSWPGLSH